MIILFGCYMEFEGVVCACMTIKNNHSLTFFTCLVHFLEHQSLRDMVIFEFA